jgi:predicted naringenin-chalcone synthase
MKSKLDCLAYEALDAERHLNRVTNAEYLVILQKTLWSRLSSEQQDLYMKLLANDRSRYVAVDDYYKVFTDDHESRYQRYKAQVERLSLECIDGLMTRVNVPREKIRLVITNHTVCGICPPLSSLIANRLGLASSIQTLDVAFMGCASAVWGMELASRLLEPGEVAVVLSAELTSVASNLDGEPASLVANTVFGDGIGAFLAAKPPHSFPARLHLHDFSGSLISTEQALDCIRYVPNRIFYEVRLQETIPVVAGQGIQVALEPVVRRSLVTWRQKLRYLIDRRMPRWQENIDYFVLHTAGNKILKGVQKHLGLSDRQVRHNFTTFNRHGNTSSASIYYSLEELERSEGLRAGERLLFLAYGSGFMTKCMYGTVA